MRAKTASVPRRAPAAKKEPLEIIVRRGAVRRFDALTVGTSKLSVVVNWDRRQSDRRDPGAPSRQMDVPRDRRATDRRQKPPFTWDLADFVVVDRAAGHKAIRKTKAKKG